MEDCLIEFIIYIFKSLFSFYCNVDFTKWISIIIEIGTFIILLTGLNIYRKRREEAKFGYYVILPNYIKRLKETIMRKEAIFNCISPMREEATLKAKLDHPIYKIISKQISFEASSFLDYLCCEQNQVPPINNEEWQKQMNNLVGYLIELKFYFTENNVNTDLDTQGKIDEYKKNILDCLNYVGQNIQK
jgi:hypothetical protein